MKMKNVIQVHTAPLVQYRNEKMFYVLCHKAAALVGYLAFFNFGIEHREVAKKRLQKQPVQRRGRYFSIQMSKRLLFRVFWNA